MIYFFTSARPDNLDLGILYRREGEKTQLLPTTIIFFPSKINTVSPHHHTLRFTVDTVIGPA